MEGTMQKGLLGIKRISYRGKGEFFERMTDGDVDVVEVFICGTARNKSWGT
jgi:hypothetical protein